MRAAAGASRDQRAAAGLALIVVLSGLVITGVLFLPSLVTRTTLRNNNSEEAALARLGEGFQDYVRIYQTIPSHSTWASAVGLVTGLNATQVNCVFPDFPTDSTAQRVFVIDDYLGGGSPLLPYAQSTNGLTGTLTNLLNSRARAMIVSSTKRGLALRIDNGFAAQTNFDAVWNWTYDRSTKAPPSGWSSTWTGMGEFLHVKHLYLPNLFSKVNFQNTKYGVGLGDVTTTTVSSQTDYYFLNGTPVTLATTTGVLKQDHVVRGDASFNFGSPSGPIIWWNLDDSGGAKTAYNSGSLGVPGAGVFTNSPNLGRNGPGAPTNPGFSASNKAVGFDGSDDSVIGPVGALNNVSAFTIAGWAYPSSTGTDDDDLFGQIDIAALQFNGGFLQLKISTTFSLDYKYPHAADTWHHLAGVGDGKSAYLYVDGVQVASNAYVTANYGKSAYGFNAGANAFFGTTPGADYYNGRLDEVIAYTRALSATEISQLYTNNVP